MDGEKTDYIHSSDVAVYSYVGGVLFVMEEGIALYLSVLFPEFAVSVLLLCCDAPAK